MSECEEEPQEFRFGPSAIVTPANIVTIVRLLIAPIIFWMIVVDDNQSSWPLGVAWFVVSFSDLIDGELARRDGPTRAGAFLDPLADKALVIGGIGAMVVAGRFAIVAWLLIVLREVVVSVMRTQYVKRGLAIPAKKLGKWKAFIQLCAVGWVVLPLTRDATWLADSFLWLGVAMGLVSGVQYLQSGHKMATTMDRR